MLVHLVKKDILVAKKILKLALVVIALMPIAFHFIMPGPFPPAIGLAYMVILGNIIIMQSIAQEEAKSPKSLALLCATPYKRRDIVLARYIIPLLLFVYCLTVHIIALILQGRLASVSLLGVLVVLLAHVIIFGIYIPVEIKYGVTKANLVSMAVLLSSSLGPALLAGTLKKINFDFSMLMNLPTFVWSVVVVLAGITVMGISVFASLRIFYRKDL